MEMQTELEIIRGVLQNLTSMISKHIDPKTHARCCMEPQTRIYVSTDKHTDILS